MMVLTLEDRLMITLTIVLTIVLTIAPTIVLTIVGHSKFRYWISRMVKFRMIEFVMAE